MFGQHRLLRRYCGTVLLGMLLGLSLVACGNNGDASGSNGGSAGNASGNISTSASNPTNTPTHPAGSSQVPLTVTGVDMAVSPSSLNGRACGTALTVTYTASFHFPANNTGGQVNFAYTTTNGRGSTPASLTVPPGQTNVAYHFTWSGVLPADHTAPGLGGVIVTSPNSLTSQLVAPSGACSTVSYGPFKVLSIELSAGPSLNGHACGTNFTETYTAIFHIAPGGPGGTIAFQYTTNNGRSSTNATLHVAAGQTSATYHFTWSGKLPADHTAPGTGIVLMSAPNQGQSPSASPAGQCS